MPYFLRALVEDHENTSNTSNPVVVMSTIIGAIVVVVASVGCLKLFSRRKRRYEKQPSPVTMDVDKCNVPYEEYQNATDGAVNSDVLPSIDDSFTGEMWLDPVISAHRLPFNRIVVGRRINAGGYGEVYRATYKDQEVAIKRLLIHVRSDKVQMDGFLREAKLGITLQHDRVVEVVGVSWHTPSDLVLVMEYMEGGDLRELLEYYSKQGCPQGMSISKTRIAIQVVEAIVFLHSQSIVHRDLKSRNVLLTRDLDAKVTDFGVSRECAEEMTAGVGTSLWMAPEVLTGEEYDVKADIFSFGVLLSELDMNVLPYSHVKKTQRGARLPDTAIMSMVISGKVCVEFSDLLLPELATLGIQCVNMDPSLRPTGEEVLRILTTSFV